jgi:hypothetical protein
LIGVNRVPVFGSRVTTVTSSGRSSFTTSGLCVAGFFHEIDRRALKLGEDREGEIVEKAFAHVLAEHLGVIQESDREHLLVRIQRTETGSRPSDSFPAAAIALGTTLAT